MTMSMTGSSNIERGVRPIGCMEVMLHGYHVRVSRVMDVLAARLLPGMDAIIIRYVVPERRK